jgi:membrane-bound serine protease (ClpP class)
LFILELKIISHGLLGIGGVVSLVLGSMMLIKTESALEFARISWSVIATIALLTAGFFLFIITLGLKAQRVRIATGLEGMIGETGISLSGLNPLGKVQVHGEIWNAETTSGAIEKGSRIRVKGLKDLKLFVEQI